MNRVRNAQAVAEHLGLPFRIIDLVQDYRDTAHRLDARSKPSGEMGVNKDIAPKGTPYEETHRYHLLPPAL